ncbi:cyclase family protein [Herbiconiux daphne]|uniref:Cyclase family protein n=1 Tax=Herbiconiux daphne TaxID=2970914 RepID=A0ABT2H703_9MICO|nr:cyclase family protein [Herbiconiux daphne]MCS5735745.1 cyclase family protein [Herbiconiux daphne]
MPENNSAGWHDLDVISTAIKRLTTHDVSPTIGADMAMFMMHEKPEITPTSMHGQGPSATNRLNIAEHTGSHVDAPFHTDPSGATIDQVPLEVLLLPRFCKYDLTEYNHQPGDLIGVDHLVAAQERLGFELGQGDVAIIETGWDRFLPGGTDPRDNNWWGRNQPGLSPEACNYLAEAGVVAVASDTGACDLAIRDGHVLAADGHARAFLPRGILIVEGLHNLAEVPATGLFLALPLKIKNGTGSPLRVVLLTE